MFETKNNRCPIKFISSYQIATLLSINLQTWSPFYLSIITNPISGVFIWFNIVQPFCMQTLVKILRQNNIPKFEIKLTGRKTEAGLDPCGSGDEKQSRLISSWNIWMEWQIVFLKPACCSIKWPTISQSNVFIFYQF